LLDYIIIIVNYDTSNNIEFRNSLCSLQSAVSNSTVVLSTS